MMSAVTHISGALLEPVMNASRFGLLAYHSLSGKRHCRQLLEDAK